MHRGMPVAEPEKLVTEAPATFDCYSQVSDRGRRASLRACVCEAPFSAHARVRVVAPEASARFADARARDRPREGWSRLLSQRKAAESHGRPFRLAPYGVQPFFSFFVSSAIAI
jgi:hypothetical protein